MQRKVIGIKTVSGLRLAFWLALLVLAKGRLPANGQHVLYKCSRRTGRAGIGRLGAYEVPTGERHPPRWGTGVRDIQLNKGTVWGIPPEHTICSITLEGHRTGTIVEAHRSLTGPASSKLPFDFNKGETGRRDENAQQDDT
jgi:hypothetical protein